MFILLFLVLLSTLAIAMTVRMLSADSRPAYLGLPRSHRGEMEEARRR